jgi:hypothetical protein
MGCLTWPSAATALIEELARSPGRIALVINGPEAGACMTRLSEALGAGLASVGELLTSFETLPNPGDVPGLIGDWVLLTDLDILFWPDLAVHPISLLRSLSRLKPRIALWPGIIEGPRAVYGQPGRRDWFEAGLTDANILTPRKVHFPDEVPYTLERIPA